MGRYEYAVFFIGKSSIQLVLNTLHFTDATITPKGQVLQHLVFRAACQVCLKSLKMLKKYISLQMTPVCVLSTLASRS